MKANVIVALLVGLVVGFAAGKFVSGPSAGPGSSPSAAAVADESSFQWKSSDMPAGTFTGMTDAQKYAVMKVMNENTCSCGCGRGSLANCVKTDPNCPNSPKQLQKAVELAKQGKNAQQLQADLFGGAAKPSPTAPTKGDETVYRVPLDGAPVLGNNDALITIVEWSDYECPFCSRAHHTMQQLLKDYGPKVRLAMRQNPLPMHPRATPAALAALAAGEQGKFWQMHDELFEHQRALQDADLESYASKIGLDVARWKKDMANPKFKAIIDKDQATTQSLGASGTPAFFINGRKISGAVPLEQFKQVIDQELAKAEEMVKGGVPPSQVYAQVMEKGVTAPPPPPSGGKPSEVKRVDVPADAPFMGPKHAKVTIVVWSDFQCPFCSRAVPVLKQIEQAYPKDVKIVFRHQPLSFHSNAKIAAQASMAAHEQGKFWEYHDKLFANQKELDRASLEKYAQELKLDMAKFKAALDSATLSARVDQDARAGTAVGAGGTPTFFVNGRLQVGAAPFEKFKQMIDEEIARANKLLATGVKPEALYNKLLDEALAAAPNAAAQPAAAPAPVVVKDLALGNAPTRGPKNAPVTIVAFSDFQCPFCSRVVPTLKAIEEQYKGKVRVAFKNQPLPFHQNARPAAAAALAAHEQGKFWEYHDKLFANQTALDRASLEKYAQELKLDMAKFKAALDSNKFDAQISADSAEGNRVGANGTPTFFINGRQVVGAVPIDEFKKVIDDELSKAKAK